MTLTRNLLGVGKAFLVTGAMVATFFLFAAAGMRVALRSQEVSVPDLAGQPVATAIATLEELGLLVRVEPVPRLHLSLIHI